MAGSVGGIGRWITVLATVALLAVTGPAQAQDSVDQSDTFPSLPVPGGILTVDLEFLFAESQFGQRVVTEYATGRSELAAENRRIAEALRAEELELAARRPDMDPAVFRTEAEAFDEKAQDIRRAQDAKETALDTAFDDARDQFLEAVRPILDDLMADRGAVIVFDRRSALRAQESIDVTDAAVERINEVLGDGTNAAPESAPE